MPKHPSLAVAICLPYHGGAIRAHEHCLRRLMLREPTWLPLDVPGCSYVDVARSVLAEGALAVKADVALFLDNDVTFEPEACRALVEEAQAREAVVGALYLDKAFGSMPKANFLPGTEEVRCYDEGSVMEILDIGFGAVAVPTRVFLGVAERLGMKRMRVEGPGGATHCYPWFFTSSAEGVFRSEDYAFTKRVRDAGYKVFADTRQRVGHIGEHEFMLEDSRFTVPRYTGVILRR